MFCSVRQSGCLQLRSCCQHAIVQSALDHPDDPVNHAMTPTAKGVLRNKRCFAASSAKRSFAASTFRFRRSFSACIFLLHVFAERYVLFESNDSCCEAQEAQCNIAAGAHCRELLLVCVQHTPDDLQCSMRVVHQYRIPQATSHAVRRLKSGLIHGACIDACIGASTLVFHI